MMELSCITEQYLRSGLDVVTPSLIQMSPQKRIVVEFYKHIWDRVALEAIPELLHPDFTFRGSLGSVGVGHDDFAAYVRWVTATVGDYKSSIYDLIEEGEKVSGTVVFHGYHNKEFFGFAPTGRFVWWQAAPIFTFEKHKVRDLHILGDVDGLLGRLRDNENASG